MDILSTSDERKGELIKKIYDIITQYDLDVPAVLLLETYKPLAQVGGALAQIMLGPVMLAFWEPGFDWIHTFEKMKNIERLIQMIEEKHEKEKAENIKNRKK